MIRFGDRIEMMTDGYLLEETKGTSPRLTRPECLGKVLGFDEPWEGEGSLALTALETEDGTVRLYYRG